MSPNAGGEWRVAGVSANEYSCALGAQIHFGDLTPYLTYAQIKKVFSSFKWRTRSVLSKFVKVSRKYSLVFKKAG
jgi:hypothetical protein